MDGGNVVVLLVMGALGIVLGFGIGDRMAASADTDKRYWTYNVATVVIGILVSALVSASGLVGLGVMVIGVIAGVLLGLKMGYGKSVGPWAKHDSYFRVNADQVSAAKSAERAREAGLTEEEQAARQRMSTGTGDAGAPKTTGTARARRNAGEDVDPLDF